MIEEYGWKPLTLSAGFLGTLLFFAYELPFLQHILKLTNFVLLFGSISLILALTLSWEASKKEGAKERIVFLGLGIVFSFLITISVTSFLNRNLKDTPHAKAPVTNIKLEYSGMFGMIEEKEVDIEPTHMRLAFSHNNNEYNRAFVITEGLLNQTESGGYNININKGLLGFNYVSP